MIFTSSFFPPFKWEGLAVHMSVVMEFSSAFLHLLCVLVGVLALCAEAQPASIPMLQSVLFDSFVSNYSRGYRDDPETMHRKFQVFQVPTASHWV